MPFALAHVVAKSVSPLVAKYWHSSPAKKMGRIVSLAPLGVFRLSTARWSAVFQSTAAIFPKSKYFLIGTSTMRILPLRTSAGVTVLVCPNSS